GEFLHKQFLPMYKAKRFFKLNLYDTHEIVQSFPLPSTERDSDTFFKELERIHDEARGKKVLLEK
ncbi:hypothetical protein, partial [Paraburkholderia sp. SIMBA_027]